MDYQHWNVTGLDDGPPDMPRGDYVSPAEFEAEFPNCLLDAQVSGNGEFAEYTCYKRLPLSPADQGYFSGDERLALYDYFQNTLVPCMELHGIDVMDAPRRAAVADGPGFLEWHPFWTTAIPEPSLIAIEGSCARLPDWAWAH